ncbi:MAG: dTDP-4-dehydrorhamnose reductase [Bacteroidia bacterium]|nr:dTDP-4-dehydrorhamnose reductase [Bacteroidia bacterium]
MRVLITGAKGQLGSALQTLAPFFPELTLLFTDVKELDICSEKEVSTYLKTHAIGCVVNCAAYTAVDKAEEEPERCRLLNATAPGYLARAAEENGASMIHVSTDYIFDGCTYRPYTETDTPMPRSIYGATKLEGEIAVTKGCTQAAVIRTAWLYSVTGNNFVKTMMRLGRERATLGVVFDQIGTPTYANDLAEAILTVIRQGIVPGIYHYTNEGVCSWYDFALAIHRLAGIDSCQVSPLHTADYPTKAHRPHYSVLDKTKFKEVYGIRIPHWEESLQQCIAHLENEL